MKFTAAQIAGILDGIVEGDENVEVSRLSKIEEGTKGSLTFLSNPKYTQYIYSTEASITIVNKDFISENHISSTLIRVENAYKSFSKLLDYYNQVKMNKVGIEQPVFVAESAKHGENIYIGAFAYIGENVKIGDNVKIYQGVTLGALSFPKDACGGIIKGAKRHPTIEKNVTIYAGATILGNIVIGESSIIGGNVWLTESVDPGTKVTIPNPQLTIKKKK